MTIYYFDPTKCEEPKPVDYKYPAIPKTVCVCTSICRPCTGYKWREDEKGR